MRANKHLILLTIILGISTLGCSRIMEAPKIVWGSSTRALEDSRSTAFVEIYPINLELCFQDILNIAQKEDLDVFMADRKKSLIVLMGFKDSVNTTEVGFFLTAMSSTQTKVEIVSLSPMAQASAVKIFSRALTKIYNPKITMDEGDPDLVAGEEALEMEQGPRETEDVHGTP